MLSFGIAFLEVWISEGIRFEDKSLPVRRKLRPQIKAFSGSEKHRRPLGMYLVLQVQPKKAIFEGHMLIHELISFSRDRRRPGDYADPCNWPRSPSGSGHPPKSAETST